MRRLHLITALCTAIGYILQGGGHLKSGRHQRINLVLFAIFVLWAWLISMTAGVSIDTSLDSALDITKLFCSVCCSAWRSARFIACARTCSSPLRHLAY